MGTVVAVVELVVGGDVGELEVVEPEEGTASWPLLHATKIRPMTAHRRMPVKLTRVRR